MVLRVTLVLICLLSLRTSPGCAQSSETHEPAGKTGYRLARPIASPDVASRFAVRPAGRVKELIRGNDNQSVIIAEGEFLEPGALYSVNLKDRWRGAAASLEKGICSLAAIPNRQEIVSSSWDSTIRFHDGDSLAERASIPVDRSAARVVVNPDGRTLAVINEGYADQDVSDGRTFWTVDIANRRQQAVLGTVPFRGFSVAVSGDGRDYAISGGVFQQSSGEITVWDTQTNAFRFSSKVSSCLFKTAYSPDDRWLIASGFSGTYCFDAKTGKEKASSIVRSRIFQILPDGKQVLVADPGQSLYVLSIPELTQIKVIPHELGNTTAMTLSADRKSVITAGGRGLYQWNIADWRAQLIIGSRSPLNTGRSPVLCANDALLATANGNELQLSDAASGNLSNTRSFAAPVGHVAVDASQKRVGVILEDGTAHIVQVSSGATQSVGNVPAGVPATFSKEFDALYYLSVPGKLTRVSVANPKFETTIEAATGKFTRFKLAQNGDICCSDSAGNVQIFPPSLKQMRYFVPKVATDPIMCLDWFSDLKRLSVGDAAGRLTTFEFDSKGQSRVVLRKPLRFVPKSITTSADSLAIGLGDGSVVMLASDGSNEPHVVRGLTTSAIETCVFLKSGGGLVTSSADGTLARIPLESSTLTTTHQYKATDEAIHSACFNSSNEYCFVAVGSNIEVRSTETWKVLQTLKGHRAVIQRVRVSPNGKWLASSGEDALLCIRTLQGNDFEIDRTLFLPSRAHRLEWSPDGRWLLAGTAAREIVVIDTESWEIAHTFNVPYIPNTFGFSRDSRVIASAGINTGNPTAPCQVQVFDMSAWKQSMWSDPKTGQGHTHGVEGIAMLPKGDRFYSVSADSQLLNWKSDTVTNQKLRNLPMSGTSISLLPDPRYAITSWHFANLGVIDLTDGSFALQTEGHAGDGDKPLMRDVVVSNDGQWALSCAAADLGLGAGSVRLWRIGQPSKEN